jgi:hypothetical protein
MGIGLEIASKKFAIFSWTRRAYPAVGAEICQQEVAKMTKPRKHRLAPCLLRWLIRGEAPSSRSRGTTARQANDE